jgi:FKBP-type peptidyl-prolyl cis-trans isomerase
LIPQVVPPLDIKTPPDDAIRTSSGLAYKKLAVKNDGAQAHRGDTVRVHYTGWRQSTGETFFTTQGVGQALTLDVDHVAPTFREGLQRLHKGEKAVLWVPPNEGATEMLVYEVEVIDVLPAQVGADKRAPAAEMPPASLKR